MLFSIVTICRNDLEGLQITYGSIIRQTSKDFEWIVVDGASEDGTQEWLQAHHCFAGRWISEPDRGIYDAMSKGLALAQGRFVIFMNAGDAFASADVLKEVGNFLSANPGSLAYGDAWDVSPEGKRSFRPARRPSYLRLGMPAHHQAMFFEREWLGECDFSAWRLSGDYAMVCHFAGSGKKIVRMPLTVCEFLTGGVHDVHRLEAMREDFEIRRKILGMSLFTAGALYGLHFLHFLLKRAMPGAVRRLREHI